MVEKMYLSIYKSFAVICITTCLMATTCRRSPDFCNTPIPATVDSLNVLCINTDSSWQVQTNIPLRSLAIKVSANMTAIKDSTNNINFCGILQSKEVLTNVKIVTENDLNSNYKAGADITGLFRVVQHNYSLEKPYYLKLADWVNQKNALSFGNTFELAENVPIVLPLVFSAKVVYTFPTKTFTAITPAITIQ